MIKETELILNADGSIYHLGLLPEQICDNIILVGDPDRVSIFENKLDRIYYRHHVREFHSMMGDFKGMEVLIISTGIGTDNIDIVMNEIDALANIDLRERKIKPKKRTLNFVRVGTSGTIREEIGVDSLLASTHGIGLDVLMHYYQRNPDENLSIIQGDINKILKKEKITAGAYVVAADKRLLKHWPSQFYQGMTITLPGFYAPQGRQLRAKPTSTQLLDSVKKYQFGKHFITNLEMETAGIYGMAEVLGHRALSLNAILANRATGQFSDQAGKTIDRLADEGLSLLYKHSLK